MHLTLAICELIAGIVHAARQPAESGLAAVVFFGWAVVLPLVLLLALPVALLGAVMSGRRFCEQLFRAYEWWGELCGQAARQG